VIIQHTSVAFDAHIEEIAGTLMCGAQIVMLKPDPWHLDMDYFAATIFRYQITFLAAVPSQIIMLIEFTRSARCFLTTLRCIVSAGRPYISHSAYAMTCPTQLRIPYFN
jgi:acyl-coenzyme A synthetase/AMP-(fatty) acid ligase